ncbi:hypothetical protein AFK69_09645 [Xenorhabdus sp. GDc328]|nr:hypothetical protein AAY47_16705 [Xenorhabdus griffiniae]KOP33478.1 hypothetical protein AFK69_09645 [Xenorhabdus sp. GDc328]
MIKNKFCFNQGKEDSTAEGREKKHRNWRCIKKSLWTDRVNVQEVKKNSSICYKVWFSRQLANTTSQPQSQKHQCIATKRLFVPAIGSAHTIGICWYIINGQIIMIRIKKTNN